ncbi:hypothetical protein ACFLWW_00775 [Chloroflexota bacterium]
MGKINKYFSEHAMFNSWVHISIGLGIAWLLSLAWQGSSGISLVLGIIFLAIGIAGHIYPLLAKQ